MELKPGQIVVTEGSRKSFISQGIARFTDSWLTHAFIVTGSDELIEASFPKVRTYSLTKRMNELHTQKRGYIVLELLEQDSEAIIEAAKKFVGRWYDIGQIALFVLTGKFIRDGAGTLVCSRLITAAYWETGQPIFDERIIPPYHRRKDGLNKGWATPDDLVTYSSLTPVYSHWPDKD